MSENANSSSVIYVAPLGPREVSQTPAPEPLRPAEGSAAEIGRVSEAASRIVSEWSAVFGNMADLGEGEILLPSFVKRKEDGFYVDIEAVNENSSLFHAFVDKAFSNGAYLFKLDYPRFKTLAFEPDTVAKLLSESKEKGIAPEIRFATDVIHLPEDRRSLYRTVKTNPKFADASYLFEPLHVDRVEKIELPDGSFEEKTVSERTRLDFDEFVAYLWTKGVRYGLLEEDIRANIDAEPPKTGWQTVARQLESIPWTDATTVKATGRFEQNKAPVINERGKSVLTHFQNAFPQVSENERLLEKIPRKMGTNGRTVDGRLIEPPVPKDLNLEALAGPGTRIETVDGRTFLVAAMKGYVNEDPKTGVVSVSEKIVHREGVNMEKTGDLALEGEHFEEHGEVQENRVLRGRSFHFKGDVHGIVHSESGTVLAEWRIAGAKIYARGHRVDLIGGIVSNSLVEAPNAEVVLKYAENSTVIGKKVVIERAVNCTVISEEAQINESVASIIGTKRVRIIAAQEKNGNPTTIIVEVPDANELRSALQEIETSLAKHESTLNALRSKRMPLSQMAETIRKDARAMAFVRLRKTIAEAQAQKKGVSREDATKFVELREYGESKLREFFQISKELERIDSDISQEEAALGPLSELKAEQEKAIEGEFEKISVSVERIMGELTVRKRTATDAYAKLFPASEEAKRRNERQKDETSERAKIEAAKKRRPLVEMTESERKTELAIPVEKGDVLFSGTTGTFEISSQQISALLSDNHF